MSWVFELTVGAEADLGELPKAIQKRVTRVLTQMESDPFAGDVKALRGDEWKGIYRRRMGDFRPLFSANHQKATVLVLRILLRSAKTYR